MSDDTPRLDVATFSPSFTPPPGLRVLVGGVAELFQRDLDLGRRIINRLIIEDHPAGVFIEDLSYGAIPFTHRLQELRPHILILVGAIERGREPGTVLRRRAAPVERTVEELQGAIGDAYVGYVHLDLTVEVTHAMGLLPERTILVEIEPGAIGPGDQLTEAGQRALDPATALVRREIALSPLFDLADRFRPRLPDLDPSPTRDALRFLFEQLDVVEHQGRWGATFTARDDLRLAISSGTPSGQMDHADWGMLWGLVEELVRLQTLTVTDPDL